MSLHPNFSDKRTALFFVAVGLIVVGGFTTFLGFFNANNNPGAGFVSGNGRLEATETDISTKLPGRIASILVEEGDYVTKGQLLAVMQTDALEAQRNEAAAGLQLAISREVSARAQITLRESDRQAAESLLIQRKAELNAAERRLGRSEALSKSGTMSRQMYDDDEMRLVGARSAVQSAETQIALADAAIEAANADAQGALSNIRAAEAAVARIEADINDCQLTAPRDGRVQYRVAQPGEVVPAGGKLLNMIDLSDVYMTFFLPETAAGRVNMGDEVRVILDASHGHFMPATISYVASNAQFTPKTVETQSERQKLMFQVKARIDRTLLRQYVQQIKMGLPGVAWGRIDPNKRWPKSMAVVK